MRRWAWWIALVFSAAAAYAASLGPVLYASSRGWLSIETSVWIRQCPLRPLTWYCADGESDVAEAYRNYVDAWVPSHSP